MLDTNACIRVIRNRPDWVAERFQSQVDDMTISTLVLYELLHGAEKSARPAFHREKTEDFGTAGDSLGFPTLRFAGLGATLLFIQIAARLPSWRPIKNATISVGDAFGAKRSTSRFIIPINMPFTNAA